jgi:exonuclease III
MSNRTKHLQLCETALSANAVALVVTETWLKPEVLNSEIAIPGFIVHRSDREERFRGGVCIYTREDIPAVSVASFDNSVVEVLVLKMARLDAVLVALYRPPDTRSEEWTPALDFVMESIELAQAHGRYKNIIICGDMNLTRMSWDQSGHCISNHLQTSQEGAFSKFINEIYLVRIDTGPTRQNNSPDLIFTNNIDLVSHTDTIINSVLSDHNTTVAYLTVNIDSAPPEKKTNVYSTLFDTLDISKANCEDWIRYKILLNNSDWSSLTDGQSLDQKVEHLTSLMEEAAAIVFQIK